MRRGRECPPGDPGSGISDEQLDRLLSLALEAPSPGEEFLGALERRVSAQSPSPRAAGPSPLLWLVPLGLAGLGSSLLWLAAQVGIPIEDLLAGFGAGLAALLRLPDLLGPAAWFAALPLTTLNLLLLLSGRRRTTI